MFLAFASHFRKVHYKYFDVHYKNFVSFIAAVNYTLFKSSNTTFGQKTVNNHTSFRKAIPHRKHLLRSFGSTDISICFDKLVNLHVMVKYD